MHYKMTFISNPSADDVHVLNMGIAAHAKLKKDHKPIEFFGYFIRDEREQIVGGCYGVILFGCLHVDSLWVSEEIRGKGYGIQLMKAVEKTARDHHCSFCTVNTMDWEALDFYKKLGYTVDFERDGYDNNSVFYFLRKVLVA